MTETDTPIAATEGGLLPCPFCGSASVSIENISTSPRPEPLWSVGCDNTACLAEANVVNVDRALAIRTWNTRTPSATEGGLLREALTEVMEWIRGWDPSFIEDPEWFDTKAKVEAALATRTPSPCSPEEDVVELVGAAMMHGETGRKLTRALTDDEIREIARAALSALRPEGTRKAAK